MNDKLLQIRVNDQFLKDVERLQELKGLKNKSETIRQAVYNDLYAQGDKTLIDYHHFYRKFLALWEQYSKYGYDTTVCRAIDDWLVFHEEKYLFNANQNNT